MTTQGPEEGKRVGTKPSKGSQKEKENNSPALEDKISQEKPGTPQKQERPKREKKEKEVGTGLVKSVLSGDRLLIYVDAPKHAGPWQAPEEKEIKLSNLKAPLAASKGKQAQREEEVFATFFSFLCMEVSNPSCDNFQDWCWQSKDFLRRLAVGKRVEYQVDYVPTTPQGGRVYGRVCKGKKSKII